MRIMLGVSCLVLAFISFIFIDIKQRQIDDIDYRRAEEIYNQQLLDNSVRLAINNATSEEDLRNIKQIPKDLQPYYNLKEATFLYKKAETIIKKAAQIENAFYVPEEPLSADSANSHRELHQQQLHPITVKLLNESQVYYDKARKIVDNMPETTDKDFNFRVSYLRGLIYHRYFLFFSNQENVVELFNQAVTNYRMALKQKPSDVDTVINVELLIKDGKNLIGSNPQSQRNKMLNIRKAGLGTRTGN